MAQSVKKYFQDVYEDEIFEAVNDHIQEHTEELEGKFGGLHRMGEVNLDSIEVMTVYTERRADDKLGFEIATRATVKCDEGDYHYDDEREAMPWYSVMAEGSIDDLLDDFTITMVTPYRGKRPRGSMSLKDTFVPNIRKENLDAVAETVLRKYYPEALEQPMPIDTDVLLKRLQLTKMERRITADASVFGQIYFEDAKPEFYNDDTGLLEELPVKAGTILVDPMVFFLRNMGSVKNTIIHECIHWLYHRPLFVLEKLSDSSLKQLDCAMVGGIRGRKWSAAREIEWQANALAPRIQMPARTFRRKADALIARALSDNKTNLVLDVIEQVIEQLAEFFEVSRLSAKIRMVELGYEEARGAFIYVDGHYVQPHGCKHGFLQEHQTFSIDAYSAAILCRGDYDLRESKDSGKFVYVDSHFVLNSPKYVCLEEERLVLTDYARHHMDECCIVFDMEMGAGDKNSYSSICFLNRDKDALFTFTPKYAGGLENATKEKQRAAMADYMAKEREMMSKVSMDYTSSIKAVIKLADMTYFEIAEEIGVNESTVKRVINKQGQNARKLAGMCLSMQLPPAVSKALIQSSPWHLDLFDDTDFWIDFALTHKSSEKMESIKAFLAEHGVEKF